MTDAMTAVAGPGHEPEIGSLHHLCRLLAEAADAVGEASRYASELALGTRLPRAARGGAWRTLLRTITDPKGLGWAPRGRGLARIGRLAGVFTSRESLAVSLAVTGLKARIRAAAVNHPELLADPDTARVLRAVEGTANGRPSVSSGPSSATRAPSGPSPCWPPRSPTSWRGTPSPTRTRSTTGRAGRSPPAAP